MRVIAGTHKGRAISAPPTNQTRPTTDRVREALMSSVVSRIGGFGGQVVLDCFAGSGALGLEALSRGASEVTFCEKSHKALSVLKKNIASLGFERQCSVKTGDITSMARAGALTGAAAEKFTIVFLDPPYEMTPREVGALLENLAKQGALADDALIVYELARDSIDRERGLEYPEGFEEASQKRYGSTIISIAWYRSTTENVRQ